MNIIAKLLSVLLFVLMPAAAVFSQTEHTYNNEFGNGEITASMLENKIDSLNNKQTISEEVKKRILTIYNEISVELAEKWGHEETTRNFQFAMKTLPMQLKTLAVELEQMQVQLRNRKPELFDAIPVDEIEQRLIIEKSRLSGVNNEINQLQNIIDDDNLSPAKILEKMNFLITELETLTLKSKVAGDVIDNKLELEALHWLVAAQIKKLNSYIKALEMQKISYPMRLQEMKYDLEILNLRRQTLDLLIKEINDHLLKRTRVEIDELEREMRLALQEAEGKHSVIQSVTTENIELTQALQEINKKIEQANRESTGLIKRYKNIDQNFQSAETKINLAGLSPALGNILRIQRRDLPNDDVFDDLSKHIRTETALTSLEQIRLEERQNTLTDIGSALKTMMALHVEAQTTDEQQLMIRTELRLLLTKQAQLITKLRTQYANFADQLVELDYHKKQLLTSASKFADYLDRRMLWVPSARVIGVETFIDLYQAIRWIGNYQNWLLVNQDLSRALSEKPLISILGLTGIVLLLFMRTKFRVNLEHIEQKASKPYTDKFSFTLYSFALVLCLVVPLPLLFLLCGLILEAYPESSAFSNNLASGLLEMALPLLVLQFLYRLFTPEGIVEKQLNWMPETTHLLHRQLRWIRFVVIPALFLIGFTGQNVFSEQSIALGRTSLIVTMLTLAYVMHKFLLPSKGVFVNFYRDHPASWATMLRYFWYAIVVLTPLVIIGFTVAGYYLSALELQQKMVVSIRLAFAAVLIHALCLRWMCLANRKLALQNARQKRKLQEQAAKQSLDSGVDANFLIEENLLDIPKINLQTRKLLAITITLFLLAGFSVVWKDILPAFSILDDLILWHHIEIVDQQERLVPVTMVNMAMALFYLFLVIVIMRNLGGLMDMLLAGKLAVDAGSRYAFNQLSQYFLAAIVVVAVANELGGRWSQVQWLVAALGVGLGFGLQEIFANMISGIILLFERPIRVGDTVSVGDITGKVNRIKMRATQIVDWDQKEVIVPNKTFITDRLVNWTLTDPTTRIVIPLGIAYKSDVELALKVIEDTVKNTPLVLEEPEPCIYFIGFGDSSLDFSIRVYVRELNNRLPLTNDLHIRLFKALQENNIEIPFPQRDLHIFGDVAQTA